MQDGTPQALKSLNSDAWLTIKIYAKFFDYTTASLHSNLQGVVLVFDVDVYLPTHECSKMLTDASVLKAGKRQSQDRS